MNGEPLESGSRHGGDLRRLGREAGKNPAELLDFSVNIRPEGPPEFITAALWRAMPRIAAYPSPRAEEAVEAATAFYGLDRAVGTGREAAEVVFGNGSNEIIHALMRVLRGEGRTVLTVVEPAFSEYALAGRAAGLEVRHAGGNAPFLPDWERLLRDAPQGSAVILANPGNPSGVYLPCGGCAAAFEQRPDLAWIVDEAFIEYVGDARDGTVSLLPGLPGHPGRVVLRSLTKFHALPGLRLGYAVAGKARAQRLRAALPAWTVNGLALAAACAVFEDVSGFAAETRRVNRERRADLVARLSEMPVRVFPSEANYVLFRWPDAPPGLVPRLLAEHGLVIRGCSDYHGLGDGTWFRVAVRFPADHERLVRALAAVARPPAARVGREGGRGGARRTPALMVQGTSSNAGKSVLAAALCRILRQDGYDVAPFKAQNMSLNSGVTASGGEVGRAQIVQARACRLDPDVRMNPVLLKPHSDTGSQVILLGRAVGHMDVRAYFRAKRDLWADVTRAYDELAAEHGIMVLEGAGSPGEINLKDGDLVNMRMAAHARASVLLVGDIDRGGVYASFLGTWMTFTPAEQRLVAGFVVNRFRGDASLLDPAHDFLSRRTGRPVFGIVPYIRDLGLPEEDMAGFEWGGKMPPAPPASGPERPLDVAVVMLRHVSNFTDFAPLALEPDVRLRSVRRPEDWGAPDVVILPGSKSVAADLADLRARGLADRILEHAGPDACAGGWIFGVCGGLQILGRRLLDPLGVESDGREVAGLGLLNLETELGACKTLIRVDRAETPLGAPSGGYEIHHGRTIRGEAALPLFRRLGAEAPDPAGNRGEEGVCGYVTGRRWATYLHGVFDDDGFRRAFLDHVRADLGLIPQGRVLAVYDVDRSLDRLADVVRASVDMGSIYRGLGLR